MRTVLLVLLQLALFSKGFDPCEKPKIDALLWGQREGIIYVFNDANFWEYDVDNKTIGPKMLINDYWPHVQTPIDSVTDYDNKTKHILFFKGRKFWAYASKQKIIEENQKLIFAGSLRYSDVHRIDAIQVQLEFPPFPVYQRAIVCDGEQIFFCLIDTRIFVESIIIYSCESHNEYKSALKLQYCEAICKYNDDGWFVDSGETSYVITNGIVSFKLGSIKKDVYQCKEISIKMSTSEIKMSMIILIAGCGILGIANTVFILIIIVQKRRQTGDPPDGFSVTDDEEETKSIVQVQTDNSKTLGKTKKKVSKTVGKRSMSI